MASKFGPIATDFSESEIVSLQGELASSIGGSIGIAKGEVDSRVLSSKAHGSQVIRRSIVQTTFKELYEEEMNSLAIGSINKDVNPPSIQSIDDLLNKADTLEADNWILDPDKITRGQLLELEVELEAESIFRVSAIISSILDIIQEDYNMFGLDPYGELVQVRSINRILEKLLAGLVPVRGIAVDYVVMVFGEKEWIVHHSLLKGLGDVDMSLKRTLYVVGVAEQSLFWKDIRRVLFSNARFRVLCRLTQDGLQNYWTPVKLAHVLDSVISGFSSQIDVLGTGALASMAEANKFAQNDEWKKQPIHNALVFYAKLLAEHYGHKVSEQDLVEAGIPSENDILSFSSLKGRRDAFNAIATYLINRFELKRDPLIIAQYRSIALIDAGFDISGQPMPFIASPEVAPTINTEERFLDSEFVAIYW